MLSFEPLYNTSTRMLHNIQHKDMLSFEPLYNTSTRMLQDACYFLGFPFIAVFVDA